MYFQEELPVQAYHSGDEKIVRQIQWETSHGPINGKSVWTLIVRLNVLSQLISLLLLLRVRVPLQLVPLLLVPLLPDLPQRALPLLRMGLHPLPQTSHPHLLQHPFPELLQPPLSRIQEHQHLPAHQQIHRRPHPQKRILPYQHPPLPVPQHPLVLTLLHTHRPEPPQEHQL